LADEDLCVDITRGRGVTDGEGLRGSGTRVWEAVEPLLPEVEAAATGRPRVPDRAAFNAIVFVLVTGIAWRFVPRS